MWQMHITWDAWTKKRRLIYYGNIIAHFWTVHRLGLRKGGGGVHPLWIRYCLQCKKNPKNWSRIPGVSYSQHLFPQMTPLRGTLHLLWITWLGFHKFCRRTGIKHELLPLISTNSLYRPRPLFSVIHRRRQSTSASTATTITVHSVVWLLLRRTHTRVAKDICRPTVVWRWAKPRWNLGIAV